MFFAEHSANQPGPNNSDNFTYLEAAYNGHHEHMQQNSSVKMESAISNAKKIRSQNRTRFSALYIIYKRGGVVIRLTLLIGNKKLIFYSHQPQHLRKLQWRSPSPNCWWTIDFVFEQYRQWHYCHTVRWQRQHFYKVNNFQ